MKLNMIFNETITKFFAMACIISLSACQPDEVGEGNGLGDPNVDATFGIIQVDNSPNRLQMISGPNVIRSEWAIGTGALYEGKNQENMFFPDAGTYTVTHKAIGRGGLSNTTTQTLTVATSDPEGGNRVLNPSFANGAADWTILNISPANASVTIENGAATFTGTSYSQKAIYQPIEVIAGKSYKIDMTVSGPGSINTWFEVYASPTAPVQGQDYAADGKRMGLSTWDGCAVNPFNGQLSALGCVGSGNTVTFANSGTIYLVIKSGGDNIGGGPISVTNIEFRKVN